MRSASVAAHIPKFECGVNPLNDPLANELLVHLRTDIKYRQKTTMSMRRICLFISCSGLGGRVNYARIYIEGKHGRGPLDFYLRSLEMMAEVKNSAIQSGYGPNTHASPHLTRNQPTRSERILRSKANSRIRSTVEESRKMV